MRVTILLSKKILYFEKILLSVCSGSNEKDNRLCQSLIVANIGVYIDIDC